MKRLGIALIMLGLSGVTLYASEPKIIEVGAVVMGTDGQMRVSINGQFLTRQSEKDGIKVLDMDYRQIKLQAGEQVFLLTPNQTLNLTVPLQDD